MDSIRLPLSEQTARELIDAISSLNQAIDRQTEANSVLTGVVQGSKELKELKRQEQKRIKETQDEVLRVIRGSG
jgi:hypothetical protein